MFKSKKVYLIPIIGFSMIILVSAILVYLPYFNYGGVSFREALFMSTSGLTTTGFIKRPIIETYNFWGQLVFAVEMEIGALGFIIFISYFWIARNKKIKMSDLLVLSDSINSEQFNIINEQTKFILKYMFKVQIIGATLLCLKFIPIFGVGDGIWKSIFMAISAFSNTGFDNLSSNSLVPFSNDIYIQLVVIFMMFCGSIGIFVVQDLMENFKKGFSRLKLTTKIVLVYTALLLIIPTIILTVGNTHVSVLNALFSAVSARSSGISIVNLSNLSISSKITLVLLMFIGGAPASTAGGVRITSIAVLLKTVKDTASGRSSVTMFGRRINESQIRRAITILIMMLLVVVIGSSIFHVRTHDPDALNVFVEVVSALSNTGYSQYDYVNIDLIAELVIISCMFIGRVGPLTIMAVVFASDKKKERFEYPGENLLF